MFITGLSLITFDALTAPVGLGGAAGMPPHAAHEPTATTASALFPVNSVTKIIINPGDVIHALSHGGAGGIVTLVY